MMLYHRDIKSVRTGKEGSALMTAMIAVFVVSLLVGGYMSLASSEYRNATRSFLSGASFALAEGGVDLAIDALNDDSSSGWSVNGSTWTRKVTGLYITKAGSGAIRVVILNASSDSPTIYSEGIVSGHPAGDLTKQIKVELDSGFFPFKNGFDSKKGLVLKGQNVTLDSYHSGDGAYDSVTNRSSEITVSSISIDTDAVDIGNADVYGYVAVGATLADGQTGSDVVDVGPHGSITSYEDDAGVEEDRISTDYYASFPAYPTPDTTSAWSNFPASGTVTTGGTYLIDGSWSLDGNSSLTFAPNIDVTLVVTGDFKLGGSSTITLGSGASVEMFVEGDIDIGGNGILNTSNPEDLKIIGTNETEGAQTIKVAGNGYLSAAIYAPNANVELKGGGNAGRVFGAVVGYDSKLNGNSWFSYDIALSELNLGGSGYEVVSWLEMTNATYETTKVALDGFF